MSTAQLSPELPADLAAGGWRFHSKRGGGYFLKNSTHNIKTLVFPDPEDAVHAARELMKGVEAGVVCAGESNGSAARSTAGSHLQRKRERTDTALRHALGVDEKVEGSRWQALIERGATDAQIWHALLQEFGAGGGGHADGDVAYAYKGGDAHGKPMFWLDSATYLTEQKPSLAGDALVRRVRELLQIPQREDVEKGPRDETQPTPLESSAKPVEEVEEVEGAAGEASAATEGPRTFPEEVEVALNDHEIAQKARVLAAKRVEIEELQAEKKRTDDHYKEKIGGLEAECSEIYRVIRAGRERVLCEVFERRNYDERLVETVRVETGEVVKTRGMKPSEFQQPLLSV